MTAQERWRKSKEGRAWKQAWRIRNATKIRADARAYFKETMADPIKRKKLKARHKRWRDANKARIVVYRYKNAVPTRPKPERCELKCGRKATARDHKPGKFRGWLCHQCNAGLGFFKDDPALLVRASKYLRK